MPLDIERLKLLFDSNEVLQQKFLHKFLENSKKLLAELGDALKQGDKNTARLRCHCLKGSCGNTGANHLYELSARQELLMMADNWDEVSVLQADMLKAMVELEQFIDNLHNQ